jgi:hemerythrin superfamily protein
VAVRSIAEQDVDELGGRWSVLVRQKRDHEQLDRLLDRLAATAPTDQPEVLEEIYRLVFPHAFAEESVLWPAMRRVLPDGEQLTLMVEEEHQQINELVTELEGLPAEDPRRQPLIGAVVDLLREDVRDEEDTLLPRLQEALDDQQLRRLGVQWEAVRRTAPTRAHPVVARRPPGNVLAALPLTVLDRSRDLADRGARRSPRLREPLSRVGGALGHAARVVEQTPLLRSGERDETRSPRGE